MDQRETQFLLEVGPVDNLLDAELAGTLCEMHSAFGSTSEETGDVKICWTRSKFKTDVPLTQVASRRTGLASFPKLASANGVLTVLVRRPWSLSDNPVRTVGQISL